jgi:hypothetical protein
MGLVLQLRTAGSIVPNVSDVSSGRRSTDMRGSVPEFTNMNPVVRLSGISVFLLVHNEESNIERVWMVSRPNFADVSHKFLFGKNWMKFLALIDTNRLVAAG